MFDYGIMILNCSVGYSGKSNSVSFNMHLLHRLLLHSQSLPDFFPQANKQLILQQTLSGIFQFSSEDSIRSHGLRCQSPKMPLTVQILLGPSLQHFFLLEDWWSIRQGRSKNFFIANFETNVGEDQPVTTLGKRNSSIYDLSWGRSRWKEGLRLERVGFLRPTSEA